MKTVIACFGVTAAAYLLALVSLAYSRSLALADGEADDFALKISRMLEILTLRNIKVNKSMTGAACRTLLGAGSLYLLGAGLLFWICPEKSGWILAMALVSLFWILAASLVDHMTGLLPDSAGIIASISLMILVIMQASFTFWAIGLAGALIMTVGICFLVRRGLAPGDAKIAVLLAIGGGCAFSGCVFLIAFFLRFISGGWRTEKPLGLCLYWGYLCALLLALCLDWQIPGLQG